MNWSRGIIANIVTGLVVAFVTFWFTGLESRNLVSVQFEQTSLTQSQFDLIARFQGSLAGDLNQAPAVLFDTGVEIERYGIRNRTDRQVAISVSRKSGTALLIGDELQAAQQRYDFELMPNEERDLVVAGIPADMALDWDVRQSIQITANGSLVRVNDVWAKDFSFRNQLYRFVGPSDLWWAIIIISAVLLWFILGISIAGANLPLETKARLNDDKFYVQALRQARAIRTNGGERWAKLRRKLLDEIQR